MVSQPEPVTGLYWKESRGGLGEENLFEPLKPLSISRTPALAGNPADSALLSREQRPMPVL